ncbi:MAG: VOC family protein [Pseudomonadota bacterium]
MTEKPGEQMSLNYVTLGSNDVPRARSFYDALLPVIGGMLEAEYMPHAFCYALRGGGRFWIVTPFDEGAASPGNGITVGLLCASSAEVDTAHATALTHGATNEGVPGLRPQYGPDFYGGYIRDPDGNKLSLVHFSED